MEIDKETDYIELAHVIMEVGSSPNLQGQLINWRLSSEVMV